MGQDGGNPVMVMNSKHIYITYFWQNADKAFTVKKHMVQFAVWNRTHRWWENLPNIYNHLKQSDEAPAPPFSYWFRRNMSNNVCSLVPAAAATFYCTSFHMFLSSSFLSSLNSHYPVKVNKKQWWSNQDQRNVRLLKHAALKILQRLWIITKHYKTKD